jgi:peptide/nickel transport system substrate-binding protein
MHSHKQMLLVMCAFIGSVLLMGCQGLVKEVEVTRVVTQQETVIEQETIVERETIVEQETVVEIEVETVVQIETVIVEVTPTPEPAPEGPRTLVICQGEEPDSVYIYGNTALAARQIQAAVYDGPIDNRSFDYQPVILEKLPSLADGDATIELVTVETGDLVVDSFDDPVILEEGVLVRPAGCYDVDCAVEFDGSPLEMEQLVVTFELKEGILWSDGEPLTAYDSVFSFDVLKDPDTPAIKYTVHRTASYEPIDDYTTVWTGLPGFRDSTYFINFWTPLPEHILGDYTALELLEAEESARRPLGWGPYVIEEWVAGNYMTLSKNELYWRTDEGLPKFDTTIFRFVGQSPEASTAAILAGECDIVDQTSSLEEQSALLLELQAAGQLKPTFVTGAVWEHADFGINPVGSYTRPDFFEDVRTRQAIAHCMDRQAVVDRVMLGQSIVPDTYLPPEHPLYSPDVVAYEFDVRKGAALLEAAGWIDDDDDPTTPRVAQGVEGVSDGTPLEFNYWTISTLQRQEVTEILESSLAECGIKVNPEYWDSTEYFADGPEGPIFGRRFDVAQFAWLTSVEPPCDLYLTSEWPSEESGWAGQNNPGFTNEDYDAVCKAAIQSLPGTPEYEQNHKEAQRIYSEQLPTVPLYLHFSLAASRPDMRDFFVDPTESAMWNIEEFDYGE